MKTYYILYERMMYQIRRYLPYHIRLQYNAMKHLMYHSTCYHIFDCITLHYIWLFYNILPYIILNGVIY